MKYSDIQCFEKINDTDESKVNEIIESMRSNGFTGCPMLVYGESLLTGSHRKEALDRLYNDWDFEGDVENWDVAEDVTEIVEEYLHDYEEEYGYCPDLEYDHLGEIFEGTWVEKYKNEIAEW